MLYIPVLLLKKTSPEDMSGLEPVIFLAKGAHIMLTMNLWTDLGLCNGATGVVLDFIYADNQQSVCFNPAKRPLLEKYHKGKTGVRLHNIRSSIKDDIESVIVQNNTSVEPVALPYVYKDATISLTST